jgi:hypothetical protein
MSTQVEVALIGAIVVAAGWLVTYTLEKQREDQRRTLEQRLGYLSRQIEECYAPLFNLVHQIFLANSVQERIVDATDEEGKPRLTEEQKEAVRDFFQVEHFEALHKEVNEIMKRKLHLVYGSSIPKSFIAYLKASTQERDQRLLWRREQIGTLFLPGVEWPQEFYADIKGGLFRARREYEETLSGLRSSRLSILPSIRRKLLPTAEDQAQEVPLPRKQIESVQQSEDDSLMDLP